jgi:geranylgeranyl pyrophosphate synthase
MVGDAVSAMIRGQVADLDAERTWPADAPAVLEEIHRCKTGALLEACARLGALYSGASKNDDELLSQLGRSIGLMFQIGDDILDVEGSAAILGKSAGKDERVAKLTYPRVYGLEASREMLIRLRDETLDLAGRLPRPDSCRSLIEFLASRDR